MRIQPITSFIVDWWPWLNVWSDFFFIQLLIVYTLFLIYYSANIYYVLFYFFLLCFYFGLFLCIYQVELFAGFLWLAECVIIFALFLLFFFLKTVGTFSKLLKNNRLYKFGILVLISFIFIFQPININYSESYMSPNLNLTDYWDNYYEALSNTNINDFIVFLVSYYTLNSNVLVLLIFMILIASVICVNLSKITRDNKLQNFDSLLKLFSFFKNSVFFIFMRQQSMVDQENQPVGTRIFKKKK